MHFLLQHCHIVFETYTNLLVTLFVAGLVGGFTHCTLMCGPFVASQVMTRTKNIPANKFKLSLKLLHGSLLPYHLGRATTYILLGITVTMLTQGIIGSIFFDIISIILLALAALLFLNSSVSGLLKTKIKLNFLSKILSNITNPLFKNPQGFNSYLIGIFLGFLPCGLVVAALMAVSTTANPAAGALGMALFAIATIPALIMVGLGSTIAKKIKYFPQLGRALMGLNGLNLLLLAGTIFYREIL